MLTREDLVTIHERSEDKSRLDLTRHGNINFGLGVICAFILEPREQPITHLCLAHNRIDDLFVSNLLPLLERGSPLTSLDLSHNVIGLTGFRLIGCHLEENTVLKELNLSANNLEHIERFNAANLETSPYFTKAIKLNRSLVTLKLSNNRLTNTALSALRDAFKENKTLTCIDISGNEPPINEEIIANIAEIIARNKEIEKQRMIKLGWRPERHRFFDPQTRNTIFTCLNLYERHPAENGRAASNDWNDSQYLLQNLPKEVFLYFLETFAAMQNEGNLPQPSIRDIFPALEHTHSAIAPTEIVSTQDTEEAPLSQDVRLI